MSDAYLTAIAYKILDVLKSLNMSEIDFELVRSSITFCDIEFGDVSSNIAMRIAKSVGQSPMILAQRIANVLPDDEIITAATVAGPGFINIRSSTEFMSVIMNQIDETFYVSKPDSQESLNKKVNIEFISANPTGPLVLVNAWGGFYGDILARVYHSLGWQVTKEYYLNDGGNQIKQLGRAVQQAAGAIFDEAESKQLYRGEYIDKLAAELSEEYDSRDNLLSADPAELGNKAQSLIFNNLIQPTLQRLGIHHDQVFAETQLNNRRTIDRLQSHGLIVRKDGAIWLNGSKVGLDKDEVLVRSTDNEDTYFLKDISYQLNKLVDRQFNRAITIVGPDHHGQEQRLVAALKALGVDNFVPLWTQTVRVIKDGQEFKMSKRHGNFIDLNEFLDAVPVETARFWFAMRDPNSHFDLDLDLIVEQNRNNPLFYVMYAYVRCQSILTKLEDVQPEKWQPQIMKDEDRKLFQAILNIDVKISSTLITNQVHPILHSLVETAQCFHEWYEKNPVLTSERDIKAHRIAVVQTIIAVLRGSLKLIGITPVDRM